MPRLAHWAAVQPDKPACVFPDTDEVLRFGALHARVDRAARWLAGLLPGGAAFAMLMENHPALFELAFAGQRAGLYYVPLNGHLKPAELAYILRDSGAEVVVASPAMMALAAEVAALRPARVVGLAEYEAGLAAAPAMDLADRPVGRDLLYSSGTTGLPKGVYRALLPAAERHVARPALGTLAAAQFDVDSVYLSPAPLYHAAPHRFTLHAIEHGATVLVTRRFDAAQVLALIGQHRVTHAQFVPTHFVRLLALPQDVRDAADCSSLRRVIHAAAPCPVAVKEAMIAWWGPVIFEYYAGSETIGSTAIESEDWLRHKGSVGRANVGTLHITGEDGAELPPGEVGSVRFSGTPRFEYLNAPEKTAAAYDANGWGTYGDIGWVDADGYLYLSDRRADLIISGGVNIYPAEVEAVLARHPDVAEAAVIGVPDAEYGERVLGVVQLRAGAACDAGALAAFCREHLGRLKCPQRVEVVDALPRSETGKLLRRVLREQYRGAPA